MLNLIANILQRIIGSKAGMYERFLWPYCFVKEAVSPGLRIGTALVVDKVIVWYLQVRLVELAGGLRSFPPNT